MNVSKAPVTICVENVGLFLSLTLFPFFTQVAAVILTVLTGDYECIYST